MEVRPQQEIWNQYERIRPHLRNGSGVARLENHHSSRTDSTTAHKGHGMDVLSDGRQVGERLSKRGDKLKAEQCLAPGKSGRLSPRNYVKLRWSALGTA